MSLVSSVLRSARGGKMKEIVNNGNGVRMIALDTIERVGTLKGTVRDVEELNTRLGI
jgi:hypothetical protein